MVAAVQVSEALSLTGHDDNLNRSLMQFDVWRNEWRKINPPSRCRVSDLRPRLMTLWRPPRAIFSVMWKERGPDSPVQPPGSTKSLAERLSGAGEVKFNDYLLRFRAASMK